MCDRYDVACLLNSPGGHLSAAILLLALHNCRGGHRSASILLLALHGVCPSMHVVVMMDDHEY